MKKQCNCCREWKPIEDFHRDGISPEGRQKYKPKCKECTCAILRAKTAGTEYRPPIVLSSIPAVWATRRIA